MTFFTQMFSLFSISPGANMYVPQTLKIRMDLNRNIYLPTLLVMQFIFEFYFSLKFV